MTFQVLARKWRPQKFEEVVGQDLIIRTLRNALLSGRIAHAFLFAGVRGVGKTTTARILAKALNCLDGLGPDLCGQCESCREIVASNSLDVQEIDAASNTSVNNIREIRESVRYGTARDRFKIYIIDEVHMLSKGAFNALLKTLEEPPEHVKFILATTELERIPTTITSRCQQFNFKPIPLAKIQERLQLICQEEDIELTDYGLRAVAVAARGSMRDAQSTLDQIIALAGAQVEDDKVRQLLGEVDERVFYQLVEALKQQDQQALLEVLSRQVSAGIDARGFCERLQTYFRNLLVCRVAGWKEELLHLPDSVKESVTEQSQSFSELDLIRFFDIVHRAEQELKDSARPVVHLEMALMKLIELARLPTLETVISQLDGGQGRLPQATESGTPSLFPGNKSVPKAQPAGGLTSGRRAAAEPTRQSGTSPGAEPPKLAKKETKQVQEQPDELVTKLLQTLQQEQIILHSSLRRASSLVWEGDRLTVSFSSAESLHHSTVNSPEKLRLLSEACARISGSKVEVTVDLDRGAVGQGEQNPVDDPPVKEFMKAFPGKYTVERHED